MSQNLSPEELALLQEARRLGMTGMLADIVKREKDAREKRSAEERAGSIAYRAYDAAVKAVEPGPNTTISVTVTVKYGDERYISVTYPPAERNRSRTVAKSGSDNDETARIIELAREAGTLSEMAEAIKREAIHRGGKWYGLKIALRSGWAREIASRYLPA